MGNVCKPVCRCENGQGTEFGDVRCGSPGTLCLACNDGFTAPKFPTKKGCKPLVCQCKNGESAKGIECFKYNKGITDKSKLVGCVPEKCHSGYTDALEKLKPGERRPKPKFPPSCMLKQCTCKGPPGDDGKPQWLGEAAKGDKCAKDGMRLCVKCSTPGYFLPSGAKDCKLKTCTCSDGAGAGGTDCPKDGKMKCAFCYPGYHLKGDKCEKNKCVCEDTQKKSVKGAQPTKGKKCFVDGSMNCAAGPDPSKWKLLDVSKVYYNTVLKDKVKALGFVQLLAQHFSETTQRPNTRGTILSGPLVDEQSSSDKEVVRKQVSFVQTQVRAYLDGEATINNLPDSIIAGLPPVSRLQALCTCDHGIPLKGRYFYGEFMSVNIN